MKGSNSVTCVHYWSTRIPTLTLWHVSITDQQEFRHYLCDMCPLLINKNSDTTSVTCVHYWSTRIPTLIKNPTTTNKYNEENKQKQTMSNNLAKSWWPVFSCFIFSLHNDSLFVARSWSVGCLRDALPGNCLLTWSWSLRCLSDALSEHCLLSPSVS